MMKSQENRQSCIQFLWMTLQDKGMKVLLVFPAKLYENEDNITTNYVNFVTVTLDELQEFIDDGTVFGVELCNEEETGEWFVPDVSNLML